MTVRIYRVRIRVVNGYLFQLFCPTWTFTTECSEVRSRRHWELRLPHCWTRAGENCHCHLSSSLTFPTPKLLRVISAPIWGRNVAQLCSPRDGFGLSACAPRGTNILAILLHPHLAGSGNSLPFSSLMWPLCFEAFSVWQLSRHLWQQRVVIWRYLACLAHTPLPVSTRCHKWW